jgi:hypothetical protein
MVKGASCLSVCGCASAPRPTALHLTTSLSPSQLAPPHSSAVYRDGKICLDILQNQWTPIYDVSAVLTSIQSLLSDPNPNSPANSEAAQLYTENRREYNRRVMECVEESLEGDEEDLEEAEEEGDEGEEMDGSASLVVGADA